MFDVAGRVIVNNSDSDSTGGIGSVRNVLVPFSAVSDCGVEVGAFFGRSWCSPVPGG